MRIYSNLSEEKSLLSGMQSIKKIDFLDIASPFLTTNSILRYLLTSQSTSVRIIIRLCQQTPIPVLYEIIKHDHIKLRYYIDDGFHSKIYIFNKNYAIIGSSNFTNSGLKHNTAEINIGLSCEEDGFEEIHNIYEEYWEKASVIDDRIIKQFHDIIRRFTETGMSMEDGIESALKESFKPKVKSEKKEIIEVSQNQIEAVKKRLSKPVVCLNTKERFSSMLEAAENKYNMRRAYNAISEVCHNKRKAYRGDLWRLEEDYVKLTNKEIKDLVSATKRISQQEYKVKTKFLYNDIIYNSQAELKHKFNDEFRINYTRQRISQKYQQARKANLNFFVLDMKSNLQKIYFADYYQIKHKGMLLEEEPADRDLYTINRYYNELASSNAGDCTFLELLQLQKSKFYKLSGKYYTSRKSIKEFDNELTKEEMLSILKSDTNYETIGDIDYETVLNSQKQLYYQKGKYIYAKKTDYCDKFVVELSKDEVLLDIELLFQPQ